MKTYKTYMETKERKQVLSTTCDFCGDDIGKKVTDVLLRDLTDMYGFDGCGYGPHVEATVKITMSNSFPELGSSKTIEIDVCHVCFKEQILSKAKHSEVDESEW